MLRTDGARVFDLGAHRFPVTTASADARLWFDQGLNWVYAFNQEEGVACFRRALEHDPDCAMAWWGVAYAAGPFYNMQWDWFSPKEEAVATAVCHDAARKAAALAAGTTPLEQALIAAVQARYQAPAPVPQAEFDRWNDDYAAAMRAVHRAYPDSPDVAALFAEALLNRTPWRLWDLTTGDPLPGADTLEALRVVEDALAAAEPRGEAPHPALLHFHIHILEMSTTPERAMASADRLVGIAPEAGHLEHMPAHVYVLCGSYGAAVEASRRAIAADRIYLAHAGADHFYTTACCHDLHMMMYAGMMSGRFAPAQAAAEEMRAMLTPELLSVPHPHRVATLEGYCSTYLHVLVRFGRWRDILAAPPPPDPELYCVSRAMQHYARGVAHAALGEIAEAEAERALFDAARARVPEGRLFFNNLALDTLAVGEAMLDGELAYRNGAFDAAFAHLREAARRDDALHYSEPWPWMHPPRHALGALLLEQGRVDEALEVYRADLGLDATLYRALQHPENVWSLHGLHECLLRTGQHAEADALRPRLDSALAEADVAIAASCCCRGAGPIRGAPATVTDSCCRRD